MIPVTDTARHPAPSAKKGRARPVRERPRPGCAPRAMGCGTHHRTHPVRATRLRARTAGMPRYAPAACCEAIVGAAKIAAQKGWGRQDDVLRPHLLDHLRQQATHLGHVWQRPGQRLRCLTTKAKPLRVAPTISSIVGVRSTEGAAFIPSRGTDSKQKRCDLGVYLHKYLSYAIQRS